MTIFGLLPSSCKFSFEAEKGAGLDKYLMDVNHV